MFPNTFFYVALFQCIRRLIKYNSKKELNHVVMFTGIFIASESMIP